MPTGEVQTDSIVRHALTSGKKVFVPHIYRPQPPVAEKPRSVIDMVHLRNLQEYESLERDSWGIPTIRAETLKDRKHVLRDQQPLDLVLMPGVAFDVDHETGVIRRLGHGKGFYDYFLHRYQQDVVSPQEQSGSAGAKVLLYGLALEEQFLQAQDGPSVPVDHQDSPLHGLLVGNGRLIEGPSTSID